MAARPPDATESRRAHQVRTKQPCRATGLPCIQGQGTTRADANGSAAHSLLSAMCKRALQPSGVQWASADGAAGGSALATGRLAALRLFAHAVMLLECSLIPLARRKSPA